MVQALCYSPSVMTACRATLFLVLFAACSGNAGDGADAAVGSADAAVGSADADPNQPDAGPVFDEPEGIVWVRAFSSNATIYLDGYFNDGPAVEPRLETGRIGHCRLMSYTPTFCDPPCDSFAACVDSQCKPWPERLDKGALGWTWPGGESTVEPDSTSYYSDSGSFGAHGETTLTVAGSTLRVTTGPAPEPTGDWAQAIETRSGDAVLRWSNPIPGARVRLHMTDCLGSHGAIGESEIECDAPDTGALTLPDSFLAALEAGDWSHGECGSHNLVRYAADIAADESFRFEAQGVTGFFYFPGF